MSDSREQHLSRFVRNGAIAAGVAALAGTATAVWGGVRLAREAVLPVRPHFPIRILRVEQRGAESLIWLRGEHASLPGRYSLLTEDEAHHLRVGEVHSISRSGTVVRALTGTTVSEVLTGLSARLTGWWYLTPEELGLPVESIEVQTALGPARGWIVRPRYGRRGKRWAIHVHGRGADPAEVLRGVLPLADRGFTNLILSYRNDSQAPAGLHGRYGNGYAEASDVDAAIRAARERGARRVTLAGWSMGGTASLLAATMGTHRDSIDGLLLDSPAIDWANVLQHQVRLRHLPSALGRLGIDLLRSGRVASGVEGGIPFEMLTAEHFAERLSTPVLIQASRGDSFVPSGPAERLAQLRPDLVTLRLVDSAEHVKLWNVESKEWERVWGDFALAPQNRGNPAGQAG